MSLDALGSEEAPLPLLRVENPSSPPPPCGRGHINRNFVLDLFYRLKHRRLMLPAPVIRALPVDGRQSQTALSVARGTMRLLHQFGFSAVSELALPSGRRADLVALNRAGDVWIVEIKSSVEDFRADQKWTDYRLHCDRLFFATTVEVPCEIFPKDTGLIVADAFGAQVMCEAPEHRLHAATRKCMMLAFARCAALRLQSLADPQGPFAAEF
jgi:hypothetical protein